MKSFDYIHKMIPILWEPGHMGTFVLRLLADRHIKNSQASVIEYFNHEESYEWAVETRLGGPWNSNSIEYDVKRKRAEEIFSVLKKHNFTDNMFLSVMHILLQLTKDRFTAEGFSKKDQDITWPDSLTEDQILELYHNNFTDHESVFPYLKNHTWSHLNSQMKLIPFEKIVTVEFPEDKTWLAELLLFYKHYWFWASIAKTRQRWEENLRSKAATSSYHTVKKFHNMLLNEEPKVDYIELIYQSRLKDFKSKNNIIKIDVYDLIFNQNIDQLSQIDSYFSNYDDSVLALINLARQQTEEICKVFDVDHRLCLDAKADKSQLRTPKLIDACTMIENMLADAITKLGP
jgi:hypothetical protein